MHNVSLKILTNPRRLSAFTLIELLVVIAIIGILAGLISAGASAALESSKRVETMNVMVTTVNAINAFNTEYGVLPNVSPSADTFLSNSNAGKDLVRILTANPSTASVVTNSNPRLIRFAEYSNKSFKNRDPNTFELADAWDNPYLIGISRDYRTVNMGSGFNNQPLQRLAAMASGGKDNTFNDAKAIKTW